MLDIVYYPDPVLKKPAIPIGEKRDLKEFVAGMLEAMKDAHGVGLAAPQVGESLRLFVAAENGEPEDAIVCINPEVEPFGPVVEMEEGCLSIPGLRAMVRRPEKVRMSWTELDGQRYRGEFDGLWARIIQHEFDHLEGILFIDRLDPADRLQVRDALAGLEEQYQPR
ncbi:MAG: peptide deformylase [Planctomycetota bacterium]|jgi:peptide deformylase